MILRNARKIVLEACGDAQWHGVELTLAVDNWEMGWGAMSLRWAGWGVERTNGLCAPFPLFCCPACPRK